MKLKKVIINIIMISVILLCFSGRCFAEDEIESIEISSPAAILIDTNTGKIFYEKNANEKMFPASTTKIMTAILTLEKANLDDVVTISYHAVFDLPDGYSSQILNAEEELTVEELLYALLLKSSNEAAVALAEHIAGSEESFASMMNTKAYELGCKNTNFVNPNGVHNDNHYSTAYDLSLMAKYAMKDQTFRKIVSTVSHTLPSTNKYPRTDRNLVNTNDLIKRNSKNYYEYAIGVKTGFTSQAKNCLVAASNKDGVELICVVLGAEQNNSKRESIRDTDCKKLFEYVYNNYSQKSLIKQGNVVKNIEVNNGTKETRKLDLAAENDVIGLVKNTNNQNNNSEIILNEKIKAPIAKGTVLGKIKYNIDGTEYETNLVATHDVQESGILLILFRIVLIIIILFICGKLLKPKKKRKRKVRRKLYKIKISCWAVV